MQYKLKSLGALHIALGGLPGHMRIEVEPGVAVSAKTVGELRKVTSWPENLVITTPQERHSESVVKLRRRASPLITHRDGRAALTSSRAARRVNAFRSDFMPGPLRSVANSELKRPSA